VKEEVDPAEIEYLADRAVTELIDDAKSGSFDKNPNLFAVACSGRERRDAMNILKFTWVSDWSLGVGF
jgi:hypothetical protein